MMYLQFNPNSYGLEGFLEVSEDYIDRGRKTLKMITESNSIKNLDVRDVMNIKKSIYVLEENLNKIFKR